MIWKINVIWKIMASLPRKQRTTIHLLPNILISSDNQIIKLSQLIEYMLRNIFVEKPFKKTWWRNYYEALFLRNQNWAYILDNSLMYYAVCFYFMTNWGLSKSSEIKCRPLTFTSYNTFPKRKKRSWTSVPASFSVCLLKNNISFVILH